MMAVHCMMFTQYYIANNVILLTESKDDGLMVKHKWWIGRLSSLDTYYSI